MRYVLSTFVEPGMILARTIYGDDGEILLEHGAILTKDSIRTILSRDIKGLWIRDRKYGSKGAVDPITKHVRRWAGHYIKQFIDAARSVNAPPPVGRDSPCGFPPPPLPPSRNRSPGS